MKSENIYTFFFPGIYVFVGVFFLTAILLAIVVDNYWSVFSVICYLAWIGFMSLEKLIN